jgi:hypothetical protein
LSHIPRIQKEDGASLQPTFATIIIQRGELHHTMGSTSSPLLAILPFTISTVDPSKQAGPSSSILSILPLCYNQPHTPSVSPTNNIPSVSSTNHLPNAYQHKPTAQTRVQPPPLQTCEPPQQTDSFLTHDTILIITEGSNTDFDNKRQPRDYYRQVNHVVVKCPITQTKWSHISITFTTQDINLHSFLYTDTMVITIHINR